MVQSCVKRGEWTNSARHADWPPRTKPRETGASPCRAWAHEPDPRNRTTRPIHLYATRRTVVNRSRNAPLAELVQTSIEPEANPQFRRCFPTLRRVVDVTLERWVSGEISEPLVAICRVEVVGTATSPLLSRRRRPENSRRKQMVFAALIMETVVAVVVAGGLAVWSRKRFAPRPAEVAPEAH